MIRRRVLVHVTTVPETLGFFRGQISIVAKRGYEVHLVSSPGAELSEIASQEGATAHAVSISRKIDPFGDSVTLLRLKRLFSQLEPTLVHAHTPKAGLLAMLASAVARVPHRLYHMHGAPFLTAAGLEGFLLKAAERTACACATDVYSVSDSLRAAIEAHGIRRSVDIRVVGPGSINGVDCVRFSRSRVTEAANRLRPVAIPQDAPIVGVVGRLARDKGIADLLHIWPQVLRRVPAASLLFVGQLDDRQPVASETWDAIRRLPNVHWVGHQHDVTPWYSMMSVVCITSYREGFCSVALEAASMALPVVAYNVVGLRDSMVDGTTGVLVQRGHYSGMADHIADLLIDHKVAGTIGRAARQRAESEFGATRLANAMADEYERVLSGGTPAAPQGSASRNVSSSESFELS